MPTKRFAVRREQRSLAVTPVALAAFKRWLELEGQCTCAPVPQEYWKHKQCALCDERDKQRSTLHREFNCYPWEIGSEVRGPEYAVESKWDQRSHDRYNVLMAALANENATTTADA